MGPSSASAGADELLRGTPSAYGELLRGHCSDVSAVAAGGWGEGFAHGHSEDWSEAVGELYYYVKYTAVPDPETGAAPDFGSCAGLAYPGALIGWAPTWNPHGMFLSVNTLVPRTIRVGGGAVSTSFIQRHAMCGIGQGRDLEQVVAALGAGRWSDGASLNVVDSAGRAMANVETHQDRHDTRRVTAAMGNASHFNSYKRLDVAQVFSNSSAVRQKRIDSLPAPRSWEDVALILSNHTAVDGANSLLRPTTIATLLLDGATSRFEAWAGTASATTPPVHQWNLSAFW